MSLSGRSVYNLLFFVVLSFPLAISCRPLAFCVALPILVGSCPRKFISPATSDQRPAAKPEGKSYEGRGEPRGTREKGRGRMERGQEKKKRDEARGTREKGQRKMVEGGWSRDEKRGRGKRVENDGRGEKEKGREAIAQRRAAADDHPAMMDKRKLASREPRATSID